MKYRLPKIIKKSFENYSSEAKAELEELSKVKIMAYSGEYSEQKITISIEETEAIIVVIYDLSNFSVNTYSDFNKRIRELYLR